MDKKTWLSAAGVGDRVELWTVRTWRESGTAERIIRILVMVPAGMLLLLAAVAICREAWGLHPLYSSLAAAAVLVLALLVRAVSAEGRGWLWALLIGAVGLRVIFALEWNIYPHGGCLNGWNLALELAASTPGRWPGLVDSLGFGGGLALELPYILYESVLIRLFGPSLAAVQLPGALWGGLSSLLAALTADRLTGSRKAGLLAGVLIACCPTLLFSAGVLSWVTLYTCLLLAGLWLLVCRPFGRPMLNSGLAGLALGLAQVLRPGLPVPLLAAGLWLLLTLPGRTKELRRGLFFRAGCLLAVYLAAVLLLGGAVSALTGANVLDGRLAQRAAVGLNAETYGQYSEADRPILDGEVSASGTIAQRLHGPVETLKQLLRKVRFQFGSYDYQWARMDWGGTVRNWLIGNVMHPALQGYMLTVILLALAGTVSALRRQSRAGLLPFVMLLGCLAAAVLFETDPVYNGCVIPLIAMWASAPALKLAEWTVLVVGPEKKGRKKEPLPPALSAARLVLGVIAYALMLALVLVFFTGNGAFIYEAF